MNHLRRVAKEVGSGVELDRLVAGVAEEDDQWDSFAAAELTLRLRQRDAVLQSELREPLAIFEEDPTVAIP